MTDPDIVDIVTLLRSPDRFEPHTCNAAADEIERLRKEAFSLAANQCHAGYGGEYGHHRCREIDRLTAERDEARRMLCEEWAKQDGLPLDWQGRRGAEGMAEFVKWDCFKEASDERHC